MSNIRKTTQILLPLKKENIQKGEYDIYPAWNVTEGTIQSGYASLAKRIADQKRVVIDGYVGIIFDNVKEHLAKELAALGKKPMFWDVSAALMDENDINKMVEPFLGGDDPIFGTKATIDMKDFFDQEMLSSIKPDNGADINILVGCGSSLAGWDGLLVYFDIPKNELQFRSRAESVTNLGITQSLPPKKAYKRFYFVDWVVLNKLKNQLLPSIDIIVDGQRDETPVWCQGETLRKEMDKIAHNIFRVRPWFEPGAWGGQWIKEHIKGLEKNVPNYAWSFELIVPENGIVLAQDNTMLEVSFDTIMYTQKEAVMGIDASKYGYEFPLRMDFLDNFDGGNLSLQCHPRLEYIQKNFGEQLTQEETYYILDKKDDAVVYLGFQDDIVPENFEKALTESFNNGTPLDVDRYVQSVPAEKHSLYLIPPGTLHSSGSNNLVLEISTTPYIFTFKMYDWLCLDLDGRPRPLNIKRGMENLYFERKGEVVVNEHISKPSLLSEGKGWKMYHLPTHLKHSYDVHRFHIEDRVEVNTDGKCHVLNLVEGSCITVETKGGVRERINYAETFVIPAAAESYTIINETGEPVMVVKAFMK